MFDISSKILKNKSTDGTAMLGLGFAALISTHLYPAYTLGHKALTLAGIIHDDAGSTSEEKDEVKELKVVSGLKATGAILGAGVGLLVSTVTLIDLRNNMDIKRVINISCGAYSAYKLGYEIFPRSINRIRSK